MKKNLVLLIIVLAIIFIADKTLLAKVPGGPTMVGGDFFRPYGYQGSDSTTNLFPRRDKVASFQLIFGEDYFSYKEKASGGSNFDVYQSFTAFGGAYEQDFFHGFVHGRIGYLGYGSRTYDYGDHEYEADSWEDYQDCGMYWGLGWLYEDTMPIQDGMNLFYGGGFDLGGIYAHEDDTEHHTQLSFNYIQLGLVATGGLNLPNYGLGVYLSLMLNLLLSWEETYSNSTESHMSDYYDMSLYLFGIELGAIYQIPNLPLRVGLSIALISAFYLMFHGGFTF